jgi:hypothetical protein
MAMGELSPIGQNVVESLIPKKSGSYDSSWMEIPAHDGKKCKDRQVCVGIIKRTGGCISSFYSIGLWPISGQELGRASVQDIADRLLKLVEAEFNGRRWTCENASICSACTFDIGRVIKQKVDKVQKNVKGICLRCVKMAEAGPGDCDLMVKCSKHDVEL